MMRSLNTRLAALTRPELVAGVGVVLIVSGIVLRFLGSAIALPAVSLLRSLSDEIVTLSIQAFGLFEILLGLALLAFVTVQTRRRPRTTAETENTTTEP